MPFCSQCGNRVADRDIYCGRCGAQQPSTAPPGSTAAPPPPPPRPTAAPPPPPPLGTDALSSISPRTVSILCYIPGIGWVASIIVLAAERFRHDRPTRFHAFQGLYLFVAWLICEWVLRPHAVSEAFKAVLLVLSILMMVKASHNETYALPLFGELANRSVDEK